MKFTRQRYQSGSLLKEKRRAGPAVWVFRWREDTPNGRANRKTVLGSIEQFPTKLAALKAAEALRINASPGNPAVPVTVRQLVKHYVNNELPCKAHSTQRALTPAKRAAHLKVVEMIGPPGESPVVPSVVPSCSYIAGAASVSD